MQQEAPVDTSGDGGRVFENGVEVTAESEAAKAAKAADAERAAGVVLDGLASSSSLKEGGGNLSALNAANNRLKDDATGRLNEKVCCNT